MGFFAPPAGWPSSAWASLIAADVQAGCSIEQTAVNEIVIKTSVGGCNTAALRSSLAGEGLPWEALVETGLLPGQKRAMLKLARSPERRRRIYRPRCMLSAALTNTDPLPCA